MKYFKVFNTEAEYLEYAASYDFLTPNVSTLRDCTNTWITAEQHSFAEDYFTIESLEDNNTITMKRTTGGGGMDTYFMSVSTDDGDNWTEVEIPFNNTEQTLATLNTGEKVLCKYVSGQLTRNNGSYANISSNGEFNTYGNVMSLRSVDFSGDTSPKIFFGLFKGSKVVSAENLVLPCEPMAISGYAAMFSACTSLEYIPSLPSMSLSASCYRDMFHGCTSLTTAPSLNATVLDSSCYLAMFAGCSSLTTPPPSLPATTAAGSCYMQMFSGCTSLTTVPSNYLPATTMVNDGQYKEMFKSCTSLTAAPELPATTLTNDCYRDMFTDCTSLTTVPSTLSATTMANNCYRAMFCRCTSLTTAPVISATTMAEACCMYMFLGCSGLTTAPSTLLAVTLDTNCYYGMFGDCKSLVTPPTIQATTVDDGCCHRMFSGCTSLTTAPELHSSTMKENCYNSMFYNCTSLTVAPTLSATSLDNYCYSNMFFGCSGLTTPPSNLPALSIPTEAYKSMFNGCSSLQSTPQIAATTVGTGGCSNMFSGCTSLTSVTELHVSSIDTNGCSSMFRQCSSLVTPPSVISASTIGNTGCESMFRACASLTAATTISATTLGTSAFTSMFQDCIRLVAAPSLLPATTLSDGCYRSMFQACSALTSVSADMLPATTVVKDCYRAMFWDCKALTASPKLQATTLAESCYRGMFCNCLNLRKITCLATDISAASATTEWVKFVQTNNGLFIKSSTISENDWGRGINGIPTNWTVHDDTYVDVTGVTISTTSTTVNKGSTYTLTASVLPANANVQTVEWSTSDNTVATVLNGVVTGVGCGNATITVTTTDGGYTAQCITTVENHVTGVELHPYIVTIGSGGTYKLVETITPSDACDTSVTWSSSDSTIASVDATGLVSGVTTGSATVTVTTTDGGFTKNCAVTVTEPQHPTAVTLSDASISLEVNSAYTLTATVLPADAVNKNVTWSSSDNNVASVDSSGEVTGVATGSAIITVTTVDGGLTAQCSVSVSAASTPNYFTIESLADGNTIKWAKSNGPNVSLSYSTDNGTNWTDLTLNGSRDLVTINTGDKIMFKGINDKISSAWNAYNRFNASKNFKVYGNAMSLLWGDDFESHSEFKTNTDHNLCGLFYGTTTLTDASDLILPATTLTTSCYNGMFRNCTNLTTAPDLSTPTTFGDQSFSSMFDGCTGLAYPPAIISGTTSYLSSVKRMFCMTRGSSPVQSQMTKSPLMIINFNGDSSVSKEYEVFKGNASLTEIKCFWTNNSGSFGNLANWVINTPDTGVTFYKRSTQSFQTGNDGIKTGWTVVNDDVTGV